MPQLQDEPRLPFQGSTTQSRHSSYLGARHAQSRAGNQTARYLACLKAHPDGLTDAEAAALMGVERSTINARRVPLVRAGAVHAAGFRRNAESGIRNVIWQAKPPENAPISVVTGAKV